MSCRRWWARTCSDRHLHHTITIHPQEAWVIVISWAINFYGVEERDAADEHMMPRNTPHDTEYLAPTRSEQSEGNTNKSSMDVGRVGVGNRVFEQEWKKLNISNRIYTILVRGKYRVHFVAEELQKKGHIWDEIWRI